MHHGTTAVGQNVKITVVHGGALAIRTQTDWHNIEGSWQLKDVRKKPLKDQGEYTEEDLEFWSRREVVDGEIADEIENIKWIENWFHVRV